MSDHLLATIIALENKLQLQVQAELSRAAAWRDRQLAALSREEEQVRTTLAAEHTARTEAARRTAAAAGEQALAAAQRWCTCLETLPAELCAVQLAPLLRRLLPEAGDDHPHGQG